MEGIRQHPILAASMFKCCREQGEWRIRCITLLDRLKVDVLCRFIDCTEVVGKLISSPDLYGISSEGAYGDCNPDESRVFKLSSELDLLLTSGFTRLARDRNRSVTCRSR